MKNRILLIFLAMVLVVSLAAFVACAEEEEVVTEEWQWPRKLILLAPGTTSSGYITALAWSTPLVEDTGITVRIVAEGLRTLRLQWLQQGTAFLSTEAAGGKLLMEADAEYATRHGGPIHIRHFWVQGTHERSFTTQRDSEYKTPRDIKPGTRIVDLVFMPAYEEDDLLAWAQVDPEDIIWVPAANMPQMAKHIMDGTADICFSSSSGNAMWYEAEAAPRGLNFIDMNPEADPEGAARYWAIEPEDILAPMTTGVPSSVGKWGIVSISSYVVVASADEELVYHLMKWLHENHDRYKDAHPAAKDMTVDNILLLAETNFSPLHDGGVRYLKELGMWTAEHQARQDLM